MEKTQPKPDKKKPKSLEEKVFDYEKELKTIDANFGFLRYQLAKSFVVPFDHVELVRPIGPLEAKKRKESDYKKIYRMVKAQGSDLKKIGRQLKDMNKTKYVRTLFGSQPAVRMPDTTKPAKVRLLGTIWILKTYLERLTAKKSKTGKGHPCWSIIAEIVELVTPVRYSATDLASWWRKRKRVFELYNPETFLNGELLFYEGHKIELDKQVNKWLRKCRRWLDKIDKPGKASRKDTEEWKVFLEE